MRKAEQFTRRLAPNAPKGLSDTIALGFKISGTFEEKIKEVRANRSLSEEGKKEAIAALKNGGNFSEHLGQLRKGVSDSLAAARADKAKLRLPAPDPTNEAQRRELRDLVRPMPLAERVRLVQTNREVFEAVIHAPALLSGLPTDVHASLVEREMQALHGPRLTELSTLERAYEEAQSALQIASDDMDRAIQFGARGGYRPL